jgi:chromosome segregation ATPase
MSEVQEVQPKVAANVVTSENLAEFTAKKLGLADKTPSEAVKSEPQVEQSQSEPVEAKSEATVTEDGKQKSKLEIRFSDLTKQREQARQEAQREREARETLEAKVKELEAKANPAKEAPKAEEEPKPEQFTDMYEYQQALVDYRVDQRLNEEKRKVEQAKAEAQRQQVINTWAQRVEATKSEMPDFEAMVGSSDIAVSNEVRDAIFESEVGPKILYHLAENPEIAEKLQGMTLTRALATIGKLEAQFEKKTEPQKNTVTAKSKAPAPINPIKASAAGPVTELDSNRQFHGSYQAWKAARIAGRIR